MAVLAFGQDEEIHGGFGAGTMAGIFEERYGKNGIAAIVDEGGSGITEVYGRQFALPGMAEKGHGVSRSVCWSNDIGTKATLSSGDRISSSRLTLLADSEPTYNRIP